MEKVTEVDVLAKVIGMTYIKLYTPKMEFINIVNNINKTVVQFQVIQLIVVEMCEKIIYDRKLLLNLKKKTVLSHFSAYII